MFQIKVYLPDVDRQKVLILALDRECKVNAYFTWNQTPNFKGWVSSTWKTDILPTEDYLKFLAQGIWYYLPGIEVTFEISEVKVTTITLQP